MSTSDRVLSVLFNLVVMVFSAYILGAALGLLGSVGALAAAIFSTYQVEVILAALLMFFLSMRFLYSGILPLQGKQQAGFVHDSELGEIKVSVSALEQIALQVVSQERGVRRSQIQLQMVDGGVSLTVKVAASGQQNLVELAHSLQTAIKQQVEKVSDVVVRDVVVVFSAVGGERPRVG